LGREGKSNGNCQKGIMEVGENVREVVGMGTRITHGKLQQLPM
jgi:hypothetical protein